MLFLKLSINRYFLPILVIFYIFFLIGCATSSKTTINPGKEPFKERIYESTFQDTYDAILVSFKDGGYQFAIQDSESGMVETDWKLEKNPLAGLFIGKLRSKIITKLFRVNEKQTRVEVEIVVEKQTGPEQWQSTDLVKEGNYKELFDGIQDNLTDIQKIKKR